MEKAWKGKYFPFLKDILFLGITFSKLQRIRCGRWATAARAAAALGLLGPATDLATFQILNSNWQRQPALAAEASALCRPPVTA